LVIVDKIVAKFHGKINFTSKPKQGSIFTFTFRLESDGGTSGSLSQQQEDFQFRWTPTHNKDGHLGRLRGAGTVEYVASVTLNKMNELQGVHPQARPAEHSERIRTNRPDITELSVPSRFNSDIRDGTAVKLITANGELADTRQSRILLVDDYSFNVDALLIILGIVLKLDVDKICDAANSGQAAIDMIVSNVRSN